MVQKAKFSDRPKIKLSGFLISMLLALCSEGCAWTDRTGTRHILVLGAGVVSLNNRGPTAATAMSLHAIGIVGKPGGFIAGYSSEFITAVPQNAEDVRIEAFLHPFASIRIEVQKAQLNTTNTMVLKAK